MKDLVDYVLAYAQRGACRCGKCIDAVPDPESKQPAGHTANVIFFEVSAKPGADAEKLRMLVRAHHHGEFCNVDVFDCREHNYIELGGWMGDQVLALMLIGLGSVLGLWNLLTPYTMISASFDPTTAKRMAGMGFVAIQYVATVPTTEVAA